MNDVDQRPREKALPSSALIGLHSRRMAVGLVLRRMSPIQSEEHDGWVVGWTQGDGWMDDCMHGRVRARMRWRVDAFRLGGMLRHGNHDDGNERAYLFFCFWFVFFFVLFAIPLAVSGVGPDSGTRRRGGEGRGGVGSSIGGDANRRREGWQLLTWEVRTWITAVLMTRTRCMMMRLGIDDTRNRMLGATLLVNGSSSAHTVIR